MRKKSIMIAAVILLASILLVEVAYAQTGSGYDLSWNVISGGGGSGRMHGSGFTINGTIGQATIFSSSGGDFTIEHGFWNRSLLPLKIFLALVKKP